MKTYHSVKELFALAEENHCSPGVIGCRLESEESGKDFDEVWEKMKKKDHSRFPSVYPARTGGYEKICQRTCGW